MREGEEGSERRGEREMRRGGGSERRKEWNERRGGGE